MLELLSFSVTNEVAVVVTKAVTVSVKEVVFSEFVLSMKPIPTKKAITKTTKITPINKLLAICKVSMVSELSGLFNSRQKNVVMGTLGCALRALTANCC